MALTAQGQDWVLVMEMLSAHPGPPCTNPKLVFNHTSSLSALSLNSGEVLTAVSAHIHTHTPYWQQADHG